MRFGFVKKKNLLYVIIVSKIKTKVESRVFVA